jgi:hypothetical protein
LTQPIRVGDHVSMKAYYEDLRVRIVKGIKKVCQSPALPATSASASPLASATRELLTEGTSQAEEGWREAAQD